MKTSLCQVLLANLKGSARLGLLLAGILFASLLMISLERGNQVGAIVAAQLEETPTAPATPGPTAIPTFIAVHADCGLIIEVKTFVDENGNQRQDRGERPLPGVNTYLDRISPHYIAAVRDLTDEEGNTTLRLFDAGCVNPEVEVYVDVPQGYELTTPQRINSRERKPYIFGFRRLSPSPANPALPGMPTTGSPAASLPVSANGW